jgi:hypothetical protein
LANKFQSGQEQAKFVDCPQREFLPPLVLMRRKPQWWPRGTESCLHWWSFTASLWGDRRSPPGSTTVPMEGVPEEIVVFVTP